MTDLDIVQIIRDKTLEFGNERFLEGWNGAIDHVEKMLDNDYWHHIVRVSTTLNSGRFTETHAHGCIGCQLVKQIRNRKSE